MKNLANCKPTEFFKQAYKTKKAAEKWMKDLDVINIRGRVPELIKIEKESTPEERKEAFEENRRRIQRAGFENTMEILDKALGANAEDTLKILAYCFFIEPEEIDNYEVKDFLQGITELITTPEVVSFFTSVAQLEQMVSRKPSET